MINLDKGAQIIGYAGLAAGASIVIGNSIYSNIKYVIEDVEFDVNQLPAGNLGLILFIKITNNNSIGGTIKAVRGNITYGSVLVANIDVPKAIIIPPKGNVIMPVNITMDAANFIMDVVDLFTGLGGNLGTLINPLVFKGTLYTNIVNVPLNFNIPVSVGI